VYGIVPNWEIIKVLTKHFYPDRDTFVTQSGYRTGLGYYFPIGNNAVRTDECR